jgi:hypothetical protein
MILKKLKIILITVIIFLGLVFSSVTFAHPGRTDKYGCHTCRTNCPRWGLSYGEYHCHNSKGRPQPKKQIKSNKLYQLYEKNISHNVVFVSSEFKSF